jgi:hypothetical protein
MVCALRLPDLLNYADLLDGKTVHMPMKKDRQFGPIHLPQNILAQQPRVLIGFASFSPHYFQQGGGAWLSAANAERSTKGKQPFAQSAVNPLERQQGVSLQRQTLPSPG